MLPTTYADVTRSNFSRHKLFRNAIARSVVRVIAARSVTSRRHHVAETNPVFISPMILISYFKLLGPLLRVALLLQLVSQCCCETSCTKTCAGEGLDPKKSEKDLDLKKTCVFFGHVFELMQSVKIE